MGLPSPFEISRHIGSNLTSAINEQQDKTRLEQILSAATASGDPQVLNNTIGKILSQVSPARQGNAIAYLQNTIQGIQEKRQQQRQRQAATAAGISPDLPPALQVQQLKNQQPQKPVPPPKPTPFEAKQQTLAAEKYQSAKESIPQLQSTLKTIDRLEDLSKNLTGPVGFAKAFLGSADASEFDATGLTLIEPIIKIFNPVGAIPVAKIELIKQKFAPRASDTIRTIKGKLNAIRYFTNQALDRANKRVALINQYQGNPPPHVIDQFDAETSTLGDAMEAYTPKGSEPAQENIPQGSVKVKSPDGQIGYMPEDKFNEAIKNGVKFERITQ